MFTYSQHIFFVGIKGVAMANLARILVQLGKHVSGSDVEETFITDEIIESCAIKVIHSFEGDDLPNETELVVYAASHEGRNNPQVVEADEYGIDPPDNLTPKFHLLNPDYAIITNIDHDHPDVYPSIYDTKKAFQIFMNKLLQKDFILPHLIVCEDDENIRDLQKSMK